nr:SIMPL domain-containing protein [Kineosporia rhizophila]
MSDPGQGRLSGPGREAVATVTGSAYAEAMPDRARLHLRVQVAGPSEKAATDAFAHALAGARSLLDELGCTYTVGSVSSWDGGREQEKRSRHQVWSQIVVTVTDLDLLPRLTERVLETERLGVDHLEWEVSNLRELRREARVKAIAEAREAAKDYAAALGLRLGPVVGVSDPGSGGVHPMGVRQSFAARAKGEAGDRPQLDLSSTEPVRVEGMVTVSFVLEGDSSQ